MSKSVTLIRSTSLSSVAEYAYAATAPAEARLIFLAGSCPLNADGSTAAIGDYAGQAAKAVDNLRTVLSDAGASITDVINHPRSGGVEQSSRPGCGVGGSPRRVR